MAKSDLFPILQDINFAEKDADQIESELIGVYEQFSARTLARGDPIRLFINAIALAFIHQRALIDFSAKMNLLAYSSGAYLDHIGAMLGVSRLSPSAASVKVRFTLSEAQPVKILIPAGTRVTPGNNILFQVNESGEINAGDLTCELTCTCTEAGTQGNNYVAGQIKKLVDVFPFEMSVINLDESSGGTDEESDENFRERIQLAPESFSNAGSKGAYSFYARSANSDICDVAVIGPHDNLSVPPGQVWIFPLLTGGNIPSQEILDEVYRTCNSESVRPDTDFLSVKAPVKVYYDLDVKYFIDRANSSTAGITASKVVESVYEWIAWQRAKLGRDINPSELNHRIIQAGAKRCEINTPGFKVLKPYELAIVEKSNISYGGLEEG